MCKKSLVLGYFLSLILSISLIGSLSLRAQERTIVLPGAILESSQSVKVRSSPPEQVYWVFVKEPGKEIGKIEPGAMVEVVDWKEVKRPLSNDIWLKVRLEDARESVPSGWVYYGTEKKAANFKKVEPTL